MYLNLPLPSVLLPLVPIYIITKHILAKVQNLPPSIFPKLPIFGHLHMLKSPLYKALAKISARFGPILLLQFGARRVFLVSSPSLAEECLTKNDIAFANRPQLLAGKHLGYNHTTLAYTNYGDHWKNLRRIATQELFSSHRLQTLQYIRIEEARLFVRKICMEPTELVEMKSLFFELVLNIMMRMIAGKRYYGENVVEADVEEALRFKEIIKESFIIGETTNIGDYLPWRGAKELEKKLKALQERRDNFMQGLLEGEKEKMLKGFGIKDKTKKKTTLIEGLLIMQKTQPEYYTDEIIKGLMLVLLVAGTDTTVATMEWALSNLLNNPECLKKARDEIDSVVGKDRLIEESDVAKLPYFQCIINETLRMFPPGPLLPHESSTDCTVGGHKVPGGTMLIVNVWAIHNDPEVWQNPRVFKPERFEGVELSKEKFKLLPFGYGRRSCPGENLAMRTVWLGLGSLIQCFEWERPGKELIDLTEGVGLTVPKAIPLVAKCQPRPIIMKLLSI